MPTSRRRPKRPAERPALTFEPDPEIVPPPLMPEDHAAIEERFKALIRRQRLEEREALQRDGIVIDTMVVTSVGTRIDFDRVSPLMDSLLLTMTADALETGDRQELPGRDAIAKEVATQTSAGNRAAATHAANVDLRWTAAHGAQWIWDFYNDVYRRVHRTPFPPDVTPDWSPPPEPEWLERPIEDLLQRFWRVPLKGRKRRRRDARGPIRSRSG